MTKRAIVLGGGGARGSYQIGVWKALRKLGIDYSIVTGSSVGAINGALMVQDGYDTARRMWQSLTIKDVVADAPDISQTDGRQHLISFMRSTLSQGGMDISPLEEILRSAVDEEKIRDSSIEYAIVTSRFPFLSPVQLTKEEIPEGELVDYILASSSWFPFFRRRVINGVEYIDGAYSDNLPAELAARCGADEIIAIDLQGVGIVHSFRREIPVIHIRSHWNLGDMLEFHPEHSQRCIRLGFHDGLKAYHRLEGNAYAFFPGDTRRNTAALHNALDHIRHRTGVSLPRPNQRLPRIQDTLRYRGNDSRFLHRKASGCTFGCAITTAAEIAGELLQVPPEKIYSLNRFNRLLLAELEKLRNPYCPIEAAVFPVKSVPRRSRALLRRLHTMLWDSFYRGKTTSGFLRLAAISPVEFTAAYYLMALELHYKTEMPSKRRIKRHLKKGKEEQHQ